MADTPCLNRLFKSPLFTTLKAHGWAVGMPSDQDMGNSEVGHNALGAGRVFPQGATLVHQAIEGEKIFTTPIWKQLINHVQENNSTFHFIGLLSDGNVHSHIEHLFSLIKRCQKEGIKRVRIHALLDGRDVFQKSALLYLEKTEALLSSINQQSGYSYRMASGGGRMTTTMDRYHADWAIVKRGWDAHVLGKARRFKSAGEAVSTYYQEDPKITDQYLNAFVIEENGQPIGTIRDGDSVVFFNFRGDRAIELSRAFDEKDFGEFDRERYPRVLFAGMMEYDGDLHIPKHYLVSPPQIDRSLSEYLCASGIPMFAISETQKYGHVTYFWNGNKSGYVCRDLEEYIEVPSDRIRFDLAPQMKAPEITARTMELLKKGKFRFGRLNYPNGDMVGHTGVVEAILKAVSTVDGCVGKLLKVMEELKGITVILADHGNADEMFDIRDGKRITKTSHSLNPVPFVIVDPCYQGEYQLAPLVQRGLSNVASTLINLLGFEAPREYDPSLILFN